MSSERCPAAITLGLAALLLAAFCPPAVAAPKRPDLPRVESLVIEGTNEFRRNQGLPALRQNHELDEAARAYAAFMAGAGELSHEADGRTPSARVRGHGYDYCAVAENIARQYSSAGFGTTELAHGLVEGWKQSPGHRRNMLDADVVETGVAIAHRTVKGNQDYYAVQLFGRPRSANVDFQVRNLATASVRYRVGDRAFALAPRHVRTHTECAPRRLYFEGVSSQDFTVGKGDRFVVSSSRGQLSVGRE